MKKTVYDFSEAEKELRQWGATPRELSSNLKTAALNIVNDEDNLLDIMRGISAAVLNVCGFLDKIKEVKQ